MKIIKRYQKTYQVKRAASRTCFFSRNKIVYMIWVNLAKINQDKDNFVMPLVFSVH